MSKKTTLIVGASPSSDRFSYKAAHRLRDNHHPIVLFGIHSGTVADSEILNKLPEHIDHLDTITLYLSPEKQTPYIEDLLALNPKRIIFNPGTENPRFMDLAQQKNIQVVANCTLVMLSAGIY